MLDVRAMALVGAAVAAPTLLAKAPSVGVRIPAFVTPAQRAALAVLDADDFKATVRAAADQTAHRYGAFVAAHDPMTASEAHALCDAFLSACHAGVMAIEPIDALAWRLASTAPSAMLVEALWTHLTDANGSELTSLGRAAAQCMKARDGLASGFLSSSEDVKSAHKTAGLLAIEMDQLGYLITGAPPTNAEELKGGLAAARDATVAFIEDRSADAAKAAARALWALVSSSPLVLGASAFVVWRLVR